MIQQQYSRRVAELSDELRRLRVRGRSYVWAEVLTFLLAVGCVVFSTLSHTPELRIAAYGTAALCLAAYIFVRRRDASNDMRIQRLEDLQQVYRNELRAIDGDFSGFDDGQRYVDPHHPYTYDLDIFGPEGLFQRMNRMATTGGSDALAERLADPDGCGAPSDAPDPGERYGEAYRRRIKTLAEDERFRTAFIAYGVRQKIDTAAIRTALRAAGEIRVHRLFAHPLPAVLAVADLLAFFGSIVLAALGRIEGTTPVAWGVVQFFCVYLLCAGVLKKIGRAIDRLHGQIGPFAELVGLMANAYPSLCNPTEDADGHEGDVFGRLTALLDGLDKRGNILGLMAVNTFALYDFFLVRRFLRWSHADLHTIDRWIDRTIMMDQAVTVATFLYNHPNTCWPRTLPGEGVVCQAEGLYHPFLGDKAVRNDFCIDDRHFYIITGANMAGKSTFLRSLGVNYILARSGMPVFARAMCASRFSLFSSMRTTDDLAHGISYFNAELLRLKQLLSFARTNRHALIILDEILKGTNSLDKLNGSRLFLEHIGRLPVSGVIATHDLELSKMAGERFHNFCFEIELGADVTYSYKISPGVARNQNATYLLNQILTDQSSDRL